MEAQRDKKTNPAKKNKPQKRVQDMWGTIKKV